MDPLLRGLIEIGASYAPWSKPEIDSDGDAWTFNPYLRVAQDRRSYYYEPDVNATCSKLFGAYSNGGQYGGCVSYGYDQDGLMANVYLPKRVDDGSYQSRISRIPALLREHEDRHADGWLHPWPGFSQGRLP